MKLFDIFLYLTIFNFMIAIVVVIPAYSETNVQPSSGVELYTDWESLGEDTGVGLPIVDVISGAIYAVASVLKAVLNATILLPLFLERMLNIPKTNPLIVMFTALVWINYSIGALQLWRRFSIKHAE